MPEAARAVGDYCFDVLWLDALTCGYFVNNNSSRRVIEKLGFHCVEAVLLHSEALVRMFETKCYFLFRGQRATAAILPVFHRPDLQLACCFRCAH